MSQRTLLEALGSLETGPQKALTIVGKLDIYRTQKVSEAFNASLALRVKLGRAGISLIDEQPKPRQRSSGREDCERRLQT